MVHKLINDGKVLSSSTIKNGGIADVITKSCIGNKIGFKFENTDDLFTPLYGSFVLEVAEDIDNAKLELLGTTTNEKTIVVNENVVLDLEELIKLWEEPLEKVFPTRVEQKGEARNILSQKTPTITRKLPITRPHVFIPVFPGTNCEYDLQKHLKMQVRE